MGSPVAVVVGVGPGIGMAVARRFAQEGLDVALVARSAERLDGFKEALAPFGVAVGGYACDAGDAPALASVFQDLQGRLGDPEVLVYNASVLKEAPPSQLSPEAFLREFSTNCVGALVCAEQVVPAMRRRGRGTILVTGGGLALKPHVPLASLSIGKGAVRTLALLLAEELEPEGIHVATVTVDGFVQPGGRLDPDTIAGTFWQLHAEPRGAFTREVVLR